MTDAAALECVKAALAGTVGTDLAGLGRKAGVPLVAISGVSAGLLVARRRCQGVQGASPPAAGGPTDYGFVGDLTHVDPTVLDALLAAGLVPLVASLAADASGQVLNVNADTVACALAAALPGTRLLILTDVDGVRRSVRDPDSRIAHLSLPELAALPVEGGMLPKLQSIAHCLSQGVTAVHVASWRRTGVVKGCLVGDHSFGTTIAI